MQRKAEVLHELFAETLKRLDWLNVGKSGQGKGMGKFAGEAGNKPKEYQQAN